MRELASPYMLLSLIENLPYSCYLACLIAHPDCIGHSIRLSAGLAPSKPPGRAGATFPRQSTINQVTKTNE